MAWIGRLGGAMAALALLGVAAAASAGEVRQLGPTASVLLGKSGNVLIVPAPGGALIVDDQRESDIEETRAATAQATPNGHIGLVVVTHWHLDHSGGDETLAFDGATIVAQRKTRERRAVDQYMPAYDRTVPAAQELALANVVVEDRMELHWGGETLTLVHAPNAHTDGDLIVRLKETDVIHMGDIYFGGIWPFIDTASGGSIGGMIGGVDMALAMADGDTVIVPAHGPMVGKTELAAYRAMLADVAGKVGRLKAAGKTQAQVVAAKPAAAYRKGMEGDEDRFVAAVYESVRP